MNRQVLDRGGEACAVAALDLKPARSGWTEALESSSATFPVFHCQSKGVILFASQ
jgi:hypothetical protein